MVVSDTSPLRYLIAVSQADLLEKLFTQVVIPPAVYNELTHPSSRSDVREWTLHSPDWLKPWALNHLPDRGLLANLDLGECEAIQMALDCRADFLLMDERLGRELAAVRGCRVIGILGILHEGYRRGLVADPIAIVDQIRSIGFRLSKPLYQTFCELI